MFEIDSHFMRPLGSNLLYGICSTCRKHFPLLSSFMNYHRICNKINTTGATRGAGTAYLSGAPEFNLRVGPSYRQFIENGQEPVLV